MWGRRRHPLRSPGYTPCAWGTSVVPKDPFILRYCWIVALLAGFWLWGTSAAGGQEARWNVSPQAMVVGAGADEIFHSVRFGRLLGEGGAVVADVGRSVVRVYGPDGAFDRELGGPGAGPGEFRRINGLWLLSDGRLGVWDSALRRITIFDLDQGTFETHTVRVPHEHFVGNLEVFLDVFRNDDIALAGLTFGPPQARRAVVPDEVTLARFTARGEFVGLIGRLRGLHRAERSPIPFSPVFFAVTRGDSVWVAHGYDPEIALRSRDGSHVRAISLEVTAPPAPDDPWEELEEELRRRDDRQIYLQLLERTPRLGELPPIAGMMKDDRGNLWTKVYDPRTDSVWLKDNALQVSSGGEWRIVSPEGETVASLRMPANLTPLDIRGDLLLGVERDPLDVERVVIRRIQRAR